MKQALIASALFLVVALVGAVLTRPPTFTVERSVVVAVPSEVVFDKLNQLHTWPAWSKWSNDRVPTSEALEGPAAGVGSKWTWQSKERTYRSGLELVKVTPPSQVVFKIIGDSPAQPELTYDLVSQGPVTQVTVTFGGKLELLGKLVSIVKPPEKVVGPSLDRELSLFAVAVASASPQ